MLENLTKRFTGIFDGIRGRKITEKNVRDTVREIRRALLEADVALPVVKDFEQRIIENSIGLEVVEGVDVGQQFVKVVYRSGADCSRPACGRSPPGHREAFPGQ